MRRSALSRLGKGLWNHALPLPDVQARQRRAVFETPPDIQPRVVFGTPDVADKQAFRRVRCGDPTDVPVDDVGDDIR